MSCFLFSLRFTAPVHFGLSDAAMSLYASEETFRADTLFSALCHTALHAEGEAGVTRLCEAVRRGELTLSDAMPYCGDTFYLPKPFIHAPSSEELPAKQRKTMKKLRWLPMHAFERFSVSVHGGAAFVPETAEGFGVRKRLLQTVRTLTRIRSACSGSLKIAACGSCCAARRRTAPIMKRCSVCSA